MKTAFISFTDTFFGFWKGQITLDELINPDAEFWFGCARDHIVGEIDFAPFEVSWMNKTLPTIHWSDEPGWAGQVTKAQVDADVWDHWLKFQAAMLVAEPQQKMNYGSRINYPLLRNIMIRSYRVWWRGWHSPTGAPIVPASQTEITDKGGFWSGGNRGQLPTGTLVVSKKPERTITVVAADACVELRESRHGGWHIVSVPLMFFDSPMPSPLREAVEYLND